MIRLLAALLLGAIPTIRAGDPGRVSYERLANPALDRFTNSPTSARQQWFRTHFTRMAVFSPYFDAKTSWFPSGLVYLNLYGLPKESPALREHPEWALRDRKGNRLYIPWGCSGGMCPQYAGDVANPRFRAWWIERAASTLARGYLGLWIDDVNMEFRVSDGNGRPVPPIDFTTGRTMTWEAWRNHVAGFVEQIRRAFPGVEIVHNSIWFAGPSGVRDADPAIQRQIRAADNLNVERGIGSDANLTGGTGEWSVHALFEYVDRVHALGRGVVMEEYTIDRPTQEYAVAGYFLISTGKDRFGDSGANPENWWSGYDVDLGTPLGGRTYRNGIFQRRFSCGMVLLAEPKLQAQTVDLGAAFKTLDGRRVRSVVLSGREGIVLRGCPQHEGR
jgi:Hypothetical glycosyl hydrolase family 15